MAALSSALGQLALDDAILVPIAAHFEMLKANKALETRMDSSHSSARTFG